MVPHMPHALCHALKGLSIGELGELEGGRRLLEQSTAVEGDAWRLAVLGESYLGPGPAPAEEIEVALARALELATVS
jgi:hypothetical protein